jgi:hypothetical protein
MRTADPTVGGRLRITAYSMDRPSSQTTYPLGFIQCVASVQPPLRLRGTVIGLGSKPLPLVG